MEEIKTVTTDSCECPHCGSPKTEFIETKDFPCNCIFKRKKTITYLVYECKTCKGKYKTKL